VSPRLSSVIVEAADRPASILAGLAPDADKVKSCATTTETETVDDWLPLVAETWIEYEPAGVEAVVETVSVDAPEPPRDSVIWLGLKEVVTLGIFDAGLAVRDTAPCRHKLLSVIVNVAEFPATMVLGEAGEATMPKLPVIAMVMLLV
jgi:hypothetical protein